MGEALLKHNPVSGSLLWEGLVADKAQVEEACRAARAAFPGWAKRPFAERQEIVERFAGLLETNKATLAETIAQETGKPRWEAATEVTAMVNKIAISIKSYHTRTGETHTTMADGAATLRHRPHGVLAVFGPYNFPGHLPNGHIVPGLLAGNTLVFKPSELTPRIGEQVMKLWEGGRYTCWRAESGAGRGAKPARRCRSSRILMACCLPAARAPATTFTASFAGQPEKILALEMGGNNPLIVEDPQDIGRGGSRWRSSRRLSPAGQRCTCARRLLVKQGERRG
ncbi:N-succinylglutamate 5-semialdehyde dehydrogenase [Cedecea neteri]|uniref:N-succinylglutamate 5-semialdehyde dehydrogenase n=1 Tax=Cedecea neteri TaxID=158822 RepID=A0A2X3J296_9ENTR|nr:N-succinylglutamate 5-semialdehyde dehydrogenase [Cedecea neteri]